MKILVPLADGHEEIEAITIIDVLRRAGIEVITAFINQKEVNGAHNIKITADINISSVDANKLDGVVLPGGMPGAKNLKNNKILINLIQKLNQRKKMLAAICAAPIVLETAGIIEGKKATSYPGFNEEMPSCLYQQEERVVVDDNIITGRGPGVALEFAITLVEYLIGNKEAVELKEKMLTNF
ncbi:MAG: DJ-1 family glyoxalase III [Candidatus Woesearchaeota archaeon]